MQISRKADYAVRAMLDLAMQPPGSKAIIRDIAERQDIPRVFLTKIIPELAAMGLLQTERGGDGGVTLARPSEGISLLEIVEAVEGQVALNRCTFEPARCTRTSRCAANFIWARAQLQLNSLLSSTHLDTLAQMQRQADQVVLVNGVH